jgi:hypothetical protein
MSEADYQRDKLAAQYFERRKTRIIAATNSLKLQRENQRGKDEPYIWVDPNWRLFRGNEYICSSGDYPWHTKPAYLLKHRIWGERFRVIQGQRLLKVFLRFDGVTVFRFSGGFVIYSDPSQSSIVDEQNYDDWYAKIA